MRLLHTETFQLKEFYTDIDTPPYAILSHTWDKEEITFQDMHELGAARNKLGWAKVQGACEHARKYKFEWIWIDSCCINKESSAELSEAINSMYQYYFDARVCYVYLSDAVGQFQEDPKDVKSGFRHSRWFTRGWTLQELLAPTYVVFLGRDWTEIGTKWSLRDAISAITFIPISVLENGDIDEFSVAQKMSWAALRETTRPEDQAYCLMGLFGVSMPPIYGEGGPKAFMRLQQEIIKASDDRSIFAWTARYEDGGRGLLAKSPQEFLMSGEVGVSDSSALGKKSSFSFNNNGLHISLPLLPISPAGDIFLVPLHCQSKRDGSYLFIWLKKIANSERYVRYRASHLPLASNSLFTQGDAEEIIVVQDQPGRRRGRNLPFVQASQPIENFVSITDTRCGFTFPTSCDDSDSLPRYVVDFQVINYRVHGEAGREDSPFSLCFIEHELNGSYIQANVEGQDPIKWTGPSDRILVPLGSGDVVASALHITPDYPELEVNYLPRENPHISILAKQLGVSSCSFWVPFCDMAFMGMFNLTDVFPPDYFWNVWETGDMVSMPDIPDPDSNTDKIFRLLHYKYIDTSVFIAVGFYTGKVWTHITVFPHNSEPAPDVEQMWSSYLDGGPRAEFRLKLRSQCHCQDGSILLTVTAKKRSGLQCASHILQIGMDHRRPIEED
ncbi:hypothetical protein VKT23_011115 [Stygiomarasmius scandens]|uniref:Heterokaryon incompatibility domain-containing protein n=1 Tax=Marasmiellus scandens TaxID=2682957 RepID=A0ABR1JAR5_9AGAR